MEISVVDIFAGPGGLGEGFSSYRAPSSRGERAFRIAVSAEMEKNAARTLRLRAFFRMFPKGHAPQSYYDYVAGRRTEPWTAKTAAEWRAAEDEALQLELGLAEHDQLLYERIGRVVRKDQPWVLIGGPPCQAYSLVGRARNKGIWGYRAEADQRHFLYQHYLHIIQRYQPSAFVMENVKGILSSKVNGELMFPQIIRDLSRPGGDNGPTYRIVPLLFTASGLLGSYEPRDFILRAEDLGVPQARHRVVLLGVADNIKLDPSKFLTPMAHRYSVDDVIGGLPALRSGLTDADDSDWAATATQILSSAAGSSRGDRPEVAKRLNALAKAARKSVDPRSGGRWMPKTDQSEIVPRHLNAWLLDKKLDGILNHEVRAHMSSDLVRYAYASAFAEVHGRSPRGAEEFPDVLHPRHQNWTSGKFVDRFKVQLAHLPSSTVTSHLSKDGHYFIHPDPAQFRSLSVREAARLQTFPDNYFFEGSRGAQYKQVGNAVPPWLAYQIASTVYAAIAAC
jgi:DNA (cytosine-5)-methyltransferase 1